MKNNSINIRKPKLDDGYGIYQLVLNSPPLDVNSLYSYLLICAHFDNTSVVAEFDKKIVGYVSAYIKPHQKDVLFIWQVAVDASMQGKGLAMQLLQDIIEREKLKTIRFLETTITPSNNASMSLFNKLATQYDANLKESEFLTSDLFGDTDHEEELLIRIGPLRKLKID